jgi:hypothetical protein
MYLLGLTTFCSILSCFHAYILCNFMLIHLVLISVTLYFHMWPSRTSCILLLYFLWLVLVFPFFTSWEVTRYWIHTILLFTSCRFFALNGVGALYFSVYTSCYFILSYFYFIPYFFGTFFVLNSFHFILLYYNLYFRLFSLYFSVFSLCTTLVLILYLILFCLYLCYLILYFSGTLCTSCILSLYFYAISLCTSLELLLYLLTFQFILLYFLIPYYSGTYPVLNYFLVCTYVISFCTYLVLHVLHAFLAYTYPLYYSVLLWKFSYT